MDYKAPNYLDFARLFELICNLFLPLSLHSSHAGFPDVLPRTSPPLCLEHTPPDNSTALPHFSQGSILLLPPKRGVLDNSL